jgi:hypothetical protein
MQPQGGEAETSAGGAPLKLYASLRIALDPRNGERVAFRVLKNKRAGAFRQGELRRRRTGEFAESP